MLLAIGIFVIAVIITILVYLLRSRNLKYWQNKRVVSVQSNILFGSYTQVYFSKCNIAQAVEKFCKIYNTEKFIGAYLWNSPELIICDPDLIQQMLLKDYDLFSNYNPSNDIDLNQHLFSTSGEKWNHLRQSVASNDSNHVLKNLFNSFTKCGTTFQQRIKQSTASRIEPEIRDLIVKLIRDYIHSECTSEMPSRKNVFEVLILSMKNFITRLLNIFIKMKSYEEHLVMDQIRQTIEGEKLTENSYVELLPEIVLLNQSVNNSESIACKKLLTCHFLAFLTANIEIYASLLSFALHKLATNRDIQNKLLKEIDITLTKYGGNLTYDGIREMTYLEMIVDETLRKYPPIGILRRICKTSYQIPESSLTLDKGTTIVFPIYALHHNAQYFSSPELFKPERFSKENKQQRKPCTYMPFGQGNRSCIGTHYGKLQIMAGLVFFLQNHSIETSVKTKYDIDYEFDSRSRILKSKHGIWLRFQARTNNILKS